MSPPRNPSPAYTRFRASMIIDYDKWKEGEPYDIAALSGITAEERDTLVDEICGNASLDWRDVEALRALGTPKAMEKTNLEDENATSFGLSKVSDLSWKNTLDLYACTECGRCEEACPADLTDRKSVV